MRAVTPRHRRPPTPRGTRELEQLLAESQQHEEDMRGVFIAAAVGGFGALVFAGIWLVPRLSTWLLGGGS